MSTTSSDQYLRPQRKPVPVAGAPAPAPPPVPTLNTPPAPLSGPRPPPPRSHSANPARNSLPAPPLRTHHSSNSTPSFPVRKPTPIQQAPAPGPTRRTSSFGSLLNYRAANPRSPSPPPAGPVKAQSLAPLLFLASNPPLRAPAPEKSYGTHTGTILWLLRVPNTSDIIATTLPPTSRWATNSEIAACIYYYHAESGAIIRRDPNGTQEDVFHVSPGSAGGVRLTALTDGYRRLEKDFVREMHMETGDVWRDTFHRPAKLPPGSGEQSKRKGKGYIMSSPWRDGVWEFQREAAGKYLKLKHYRDGGEKGVLLSVVEFRGRWERLVAELEGEERGGVGMLVLHPTGMQAMDLCVAANFVAVEEKWRKWEGERKERGHGGGGR